MYSELAQAHIARPAEPGADGRRDARGRGGRAGLLRPAAHGEHVGIRLRGQQIGGAPRGVFVVHDGGGVTCLTPHAQSGCDGQALRYSAFGGSPFGRECIVPEGHTPYGL